MSYCVNCGVELDLSEVCCPLCGTEVINPRQPQKEPVCRPYPAYFEYVMQKVDRRFFSLLALIVLLIPVTVCLLIDFVTPKGTFWSLYVVGAAAVIGMTALFPLIFRHPHPWLFWMVDVAVLLLYLTLVAWLAQGWGWFFRLALPVFIVAGTESGLLLLYFRRRKHSGVLMPVSLVLYGAAFLCLVIEVLLMFYLQRPFVFLWSWYVAVACGLLGTAALILNKRNRWKENIRKRLFF